MDYQNKKIAVLGLGKSGEAAADLLKRKGAEVTVIDRANNEKLEQRLSELGVAGKLGVEEAAGDFDRAVLSPGIDAESDFAAPLRARGVELIGELELAFEFCECPIIAITGTNGKTSTTGLAAQMFRAAECRVLEGGNIGTAFTSLVEESAEKDLAVIEVSSFQLETIRRFKPRVAVLLNFGPDHMDRYRNLEDYWQAKLRIFENQTPEETAVINAALDVPEISARRLNFSAYQNGGDFSVRGEEIFFRETAVFDLRRAQLRGRHNAENIMAALAAGHAMNLGWEEMRPGIEAYQPPPHRCEPVGEINGATFINDSKGTNLDSVRKALETYHEPVVLIAGGKDKGVGYEPLNDLVREKVKAAMLIGEMREQIARTWDGFFPTHLCGSLAEAVKKAAALAAPGEIVLFSPGTSSFDMFENYEDRGDQFRAFVQQLQKKNTA